MVGMILVTGNVSFAGLAFYDDFNDSGLSDWSISTSGSVSAGSGVSANTPSSMLKLIVNSTAGTSGVYATFNTPINMPEVATSITQMVKIGGGAYGPVYDTWLVGSLSSTTFDTTGANGGYLRFRVWESSGNRVFYLYRRNIYGSEVQVLSTSASGAPAANDRVSVTYSPTHVTSIKYYDYGSDTTTEMLASPVAHGLNFYTAFHGKAYTAVAFTTTPWTLREAYYDRVTVTVDPEPIVYNDFNDSGLSDWSISTSGSLSAGSEVTANTPSSMLKLKVNSTTGTSGIYATNNTPVDHPTNISSVAQTFEIGGGAYGPVYDIWLVGSLSSTTFDTSATNGGYLRFRAWESSSSRVFYVYRCNIDGSQTVVTYTSISGSYGVYDQATVTYSQTHVTSIKYYDYSVGTTTELLATPIAHGLDFATAFPDGAYTAVAFTTTPWTLRETYYDSVLTGVTYEPVITTVLGSCIASHNTASLSEVEKAALIEDVLTDTENKGFSMNWEASPSSGQSGLPENTTEIAYCNNMIEEVEDHGMANCLQFRFARMLPSNPDATELTWYGKVLNPTTSLIVRETTSDKRRWNYGSPAALTAFASRCEDLFADMGPYQMFIVDEEKLSDTGTNMLEDGVIVSKYWTSPTYSAEALGDVNTAGTFRHFLASMSYPNASTTKFPVTTVAVPAWPTNGSVASDGLPAITINAGNSDLLQADNGWPNSTLWSYWYQWRTNLMRYYVDAACEAANGEWGSRSDWQGCVFSAPYYWYDIQLGFTAHHIAHSDVDYIVAGYYSGTDFQDVKDMALEHGKKWGGMVELSYAGEQTGETPATIIDTFQTHINAGASIMYLYAGANFRTDRTTPRADGAYYMPDQIEAWAECIEWLEQRSKFKRIPVAP